MLWLHQSPSSRPAAVLWYCQSPFWQAGSSAVVLSLTLLAGRQQCFAACPGPQAASTPVTGLPVDEQGCWGEIESWHCLSGGRSEGWSRLYPRGSLGYLQAYQQYDSSHPQQPKTVMGRSDMLFTPSNTHSTACLQRSRCFWVMLVPCHHVEVAKLSKQVHAPYRCGHAMLRHLRGSPPCPCGCWGCCAALHGSLAG